MYNKKHKIKNDWRNNKWKLRNQPCQTSSTRITINNCCLSSTRLSDSTFPFFPTPNLSQFSETNSLFFAKLACWVNKSSFSVPCYPKNSVLVERNRTWIYPIYWSSIFNWVIWLKGRNGESEEYIEAETEPSTAFERLATSSPTRMSKYRTPNSR